MRERQASKIAARRWAGWPRRLALVALLALAAAGLWLGSSARLVRLAERPLLPTRFDHKFHKQINCTACHHNFLDRRLGAGTCLACHKAWGTSEARRIDIVFHAFCTDCHRRRWAAGERAGPVKACAACHVDPDAARFAIETRRR